MSSQDDLLKKGVFDLRQVLAERQYPEEDVEFYIDEVLGHALEKASSTLGKLKNSLAVAKLDEDKKLIEQSEAAVKKAESAIAELRASATPYVATVRSISRRAKEDIQSKALSKIPIRRDIYGNDDAKNEIERTNLIEQMIWAATLREIRSPEGGVQVFSGLDDLEIVQNIMGMIPESAYRTIGNKIGELIDTGVQFEFAAKDEDFSSKS